MKRRDVLKSVVPAAGVLFANSTLAVPCRPGLALDGDTPPVVGCGSGGAALMPDWNDEAATYANRGFTAIRALDLEDANSSGGVTTFISHPGQPPVAPSSFADIHNDTEGDDLWTAYHQYRRLDGIRQASADSWFTRASNLADFFTNHYVDGTSWVNDQNHDHFYGWGLCDWADGQNDSAALATIDTMVARMAAWFDESSGNMRTAPGDDISQQGNHSRRWARQLRFAVAAQRVSPSSANQAWRDKCIDIVMQTPSWVASHNIYGLSSSSTSNAGFDFAGGDRVQINFHQGIWMDSMWHAWLELDAEGDSRAASVRQRLIDMATFWRDLPLDPSTNFVPLRVGRNVNTNAALRGGGAGAPDGVYTVCSTNGLVFAYKLTGDVTYLDKAWAHWAAWQTGTGLSGSANTIHHYVDTEIRQNVDVLAHNKGELQYVYALFENGGSPALV